MARFLAESRHDALMAEMTHTRCVSDTASMVVLAHTGVEFDDKTFSDTLGNLAAVAKEYGASPDDVQRALEFHEPSLACGEL